jgi:hypothetical protein
VALHARHEAYLRIAVGRSAEGEREVDRDDRGDGAEDDRVPRQADAVGVDKDDQTHGEHDDAIATRTTIGNSSSKVPAWRFLMGSGAPGGLVTSLYSCEAASSGDRGLEGLDRREACECPPTVGAPWGRRAFSLALVEVVGRGRQETTGYWLRGSPHPI